MRETPWADGSALYALLSGGPRPTYRESLDKPKLNWYGEVIPQIVLVRNNIGRLGKPKRAPRLPE